MPCTGGHKGHKKSPTREVRQSMLSVMKVLLLNRSGKFFPCLKANVTTRRNVYRCIVFRVATCSGRTTGDLEGAEVPQSQFAVFGSHFDDFLEEGVQEFIGILVGNTYSIAQPSF